MALSTTETAKVFFIYGIPQNNSGYIVTELSTLYGAFAETYDFTAVVTKLNAALTALNSDQVTLVQALITAWDAIPSGSRLRIERSSDGAVGQIVNHPAEREQIRQDVARIVGFDCPPGGFVLRAPGGVNRIMR